MLSATNRSTNSGIALYNQTDLQNSSVSRSQTEQDNKVYRIGTKLVIGTVFVVVGFGTLYCKHISRPCHEVYSHPELLGGNQCDDYDPNYPKTNAFIKSCLVSGLFCVFAATHDLLTKF